jgi:hypothetical protein
MRKKIGLLIFIATSVSVTLYFSLMKQNNYSIIYNDGPHIIDINDTIVKLIEIRQTSEKTSSPDINLYFKTVNKNDYLNSYLHNNYKPSNLSVSKFFNVDSIFCVGDVHGNLEALTLLLQNNKIIDDRLNWRFGKGHLVFCGDVFDRGDKVTECLWLIYKLEQQANKNGGYVHFLLGNHEIMVLKGDLRYLHKKYKYIQSKLGIQYSFFFNNNTVLGEWLRTKNSVIQLNDALFLHGGLHPDNITMNIDINDINQFIRCYLNDIDFNDTIRFLINQKGSLWYRGYLTSDENYPLISNSEVDDLLKHFNVNKIVFAHTTVNNIKSLNQGKLIAVDVPMTVENSEGLVINRNKYYSVNISGKKLQEFQY